MKFLLRPFLILGVAACAYAVTCHFDYLGSSQLSAALPRGINLAGAEFGTHVPGFGGPSPGQYGVDYIYCSNQTLQAFAETGITQVRMPFRWERLQPELGGELDTFELGRITEFLDAASVMQCEVVLDLHNYGRYSRSESAYPQGRTVVPLPTSAEDVTMVHLADLWCKLAKAVRGHRGVKALALMNEPHDMGEGNWRAISQFVVRKLREQGHENVLWVSGDGWSHAHDWAKNNGVDAWIQDPLGRVVYEAHCYFDGDFSGKYARSYAEESVADARIESRGARLVEPFLKWCRRNNVDGVIGEYGVPSGEPEWIPVMQGFLDLADSYDVPTYYWAGGDWWGDNNLAIVPESVDTQPQWEVLVGR